MSPRYSIIVPIYNRPDEANELLESLSLQTEKDFELVLIEDGSSQNCEAAVELYRNKLAIQYIKKENTGRSDTRNVGMAHAKGGYFVFFDSDCIIPPQYFEQLSKQLDTNYTPCFGGPDKEHSSFSDMQKAINYAMTSFWTTGGIRGGKVQLEQFKPRTFNMGFVKEVYLEVGGFKDMFGEDIDLVMRMLNAGYTTKLYPDLFVYHKRRVDLKKFYKQVNIFGHARINLYILYPQSLKLVHCLPAFFVISLFGLVPLLFISPYFISPLLLYTLLLFIDSLNKTKSLNIALLASVACFIQLIGYGLGFISSYVSKVLFKKGLEDVETLRAKYK